MADFAPNPGSRTGKGYGSKRIGTLQNLGDVEFSDAAISNGYALVWNSTTQRWTTGAVASALSSLSDVTVSEGAGIDTFLLYWNNGASKWEAKAFSFGNISGSVAAGQMPALTGDITTPAGAVATTLATVNGSPSSYGAADHTLEAT